ncbi:MAG: hypothetical protein ATN31_05470 [Candidatus Epulonipiscioides saccharophilum]|nr:MAG: hypothetical protein ATN31_05470 [Epulopiscium sp. AS2M-Bin001]
MNNFKDFSKFGLGGLSHLNIVENEKSITTASIPPISILDIIYQRKYKCPICNSEFTNSAIKSGKNQLKSVDNDLRATYSLADPMLYDIITCPCGHTAISSAFNTLLPSQRSIVRNQICAHYIPVQIEEVRSTQYALDLYQLGLANCLVRHGKNIEKAILCLRLSWLYKDLNQLEAEKEFITNAYECFSLSLDQDTYPILGFDFHRAVYTTAVLAFKLGFYDKSSQLVSAILINTNVHARLKEHILELKSQLSKVKSK